MPIDVKVVPDEGKDKQATIAKEIQKFEEWFMHALHNAEPLTRPERAILTDYLGWKAGG